MKLFSFLFLAVACILATSCEKKQTYSGPYMHCVRLNLQNEPTTLDPRKGGDVISSNMHFLLFEGLVRLNPDNSVTSAQAESFKISEDGLTYTFIMRDNLTWSNGDPITAYDFEKSWKDILDPAFPSHCAYLLYPIKNAEAAKKGLCALHDVGIEAKDAKTFVVTLEKPTPYFLDLISFCVFFPVNIEKDRQVADWAFNSGEHFSSNGPFILKEWKHNDEIVAIRNPFYWDKSRVRPDEIRFSIVEHPMTALQMFENGQLDMIGEPLCPLPTDALPTLKKSGKIQKSPTAGTMMFAFNVDQFPFNNAKIRKAFSYAIDRKSIVKNITQMGEVAACNIVPPILKNNRNYKFFKDADYQKARELLEEGMRELGTDKEAFAKVSFIYAGSDMNHKIAQVLQQQWQQVLGIEIKLEHLDHKILMDKMIKRDYALGQNMWIAQYNDQMNILERFKTKKNLKNYAGWENGEFSRLLDESFYVNGVERSAVLEKAEAILLDEMPFCPIYHLEMAYLLQPYIKDIGMTPIGDIVFQTLVLSGEKKR